MNQNVIYLHPLEWEKWRTSAEFYQLGGVDYTLPVQPMSAKETRAFDELRAHVRAIKV